MLELIVRLLRKWRPLEGWLLWTMALTTLLMIPAAAESAALEGGRFTRLAGLHADERDFERLAVIREDQRRGAEAYLPGAGHALHPAHAGQ